MSRFSVAAAAAAFVLTATSHAHAAELAGASAAVGQGTVASYAVIGTDGAPAEIGLRFTAGALAGLPAEHNPDSACFDVNGDGQIALIGECLGDYEYVLPLPAELTAREDVTFDFALLNWEPHGHPPEPWALPHFDLHFYSVPVEVVEAMRPGPCGFLLHCDDFARATTPVPAKYLHPEHASVGAAVVRMGDHLIDTKTPELAEGGPPFTHTWIYGAFEGRIIFHEVMATLDFMVATGDLCHPIKQPEAWERAGYYPTRYCFRREADGGLSVYMAGFVMRPAGS